MSTESESRTETSGENDSNRTVRHEFEGHTSATTAVIEAVAAARGTEPTDLPTLYDVIDPDALDELFEAGGGSDRPERCVEFAYAGCTVRVRTGPHVTVCMAGE